MSKKSHILSIGFEIPGQSENCLNFGTTKSFMDADIIIISPKEIYPSGSSWISFSAGGGCYDVGAAERFFKNTNRLKKEVEDSLKLGKTVFVFLSEKENFSLATGVTHPRKGQNLYNTTTSSNYAFLSTKIGDITSASGKHLIYSGNPIFNEFNNKFKDKLKYRAYLESTGNAQITYKGKDETKILGAIYNAHNGHLVVIPQLEYDYDSFVEYDEKLDKEVWTDEAIRFGKELSSVLSNINRQLSRKSEKTPPPTWSLDKKYSTIESINIESKIESSQIEIENIKSEIERLKQQLSNENQLKDLLYEQGKSLEDAVTKALIILGYKAENYDDGELELDQVIISPEKVRYIGECEGKDSKDININKFRQLLESLNADFARDDVEEKAFGILFGNPQRLEEPSKRKLDFTKKCKIGADREKIALVKTSELFAVANYLQQNRNQRFKKACKKAIFDGLGKIVVFPNLPKRKITPNTV